MEITVSKAARRQRIARPVTQEVFRTASIAALGDGIAVLGGRKGDRRNSCSEFVLKNSRGASVSTSHIAHALAGCDLSVPGNTPNQVKDSFMGRLIASLPQSMVHVLAPDFAIEGIQLVIVIPNISDRHGT